MTQYVVAETVTLLRYIEAENEQAAIAKAKERGVGDFDEVDNTVQSVFTVSEDQN